QLIHRGLVFDAVSQQRLESLENVSSANAMDHHVRRRSRPASALRLFVDPPHRARLWIQLQTASKKRPIQPKSGDKDAIFDVFCGENSAIIGIPYDVIDAYQSHRLRLGLLHPGEHRPRHRSSSLQYRSPRNLALIHRVTDRNHVAHPNHSQLPHMPLHQHFAVYFQRGLVDAHPLAPSRRQQDASHSSFDYNCCIMYLRLTLLALAGSSLFAQAPAAKPEVPPPPIQVQVNEVIVPVTVTDEKGRFVSDLDQKDFTVYDEGKEQQIQFFTRERSQPVVVGFLVDLSNNSRLHWKNYQDAA